MQQQSVKKLVYTALCIGLGLVVPSLFHLAGAGAGKVFLPMHIPVLLCGFIAGPAYGMACGFILPLLSSMITGMPPLFPIALAISLECACYGLVTGVLYARWQRIYPSLILAMAAGRLVSGLANAAFMGLAGNPYSLTIWMTGAFLTPIPGIIIQLVLIPTLVYALERSGVLPKPQRA